MSSSPVSIDVVFAKLAVTYGRDFTDRYAALDPAAVRADWERELAPFLYYRQQAVLFALDNLPSGKPPTVLEFRQICNRAPELDIPRLPPPKANDANVRRLLALARKKVLEQRVDRVTAAQRLQERADAGEIKLTQAQRDWIRAALSCGPAARDAE